jgi:hypothetical protein
LKEIDRGFAVPAAIAAARRYRVMFLPRTVRWRPDGPMESVKTSHQVNNIERRCDAA